MRLLGRVLAIALALAPFRMKAQHTTAPAATSSGTSIQQDAALHARALAAVDAEHARARQPLCPNAMTTVDINACRFQELSFTDSNYLRLARAVGALLRSEDEEPAKSTPIPFDGAEAAWHTYRDQACNAAGLEYEGGSMQPSIELGCKLTITRHHMDELWDLYNDLGTR